MGLKYQVDSLDDVEKEHQALYREDGDVFVLDVDGAVAASKLEEDRRKWRATEKEAKAAAAKLKLYGALGMEPEEIQSLAEKARELEEQVRAASGGKREDIEAQIRKQYEREHGERLKTLETQLGEMSAKAEAAEKRIQLDKLKKDARDAAAKAGVTPKWLDLLVDDRVETGKIVRDENGEIAFVAGDAAKAFDEYIKSEIDARPEVAGESTGGGAPGSRGVRLPGKRVVDRNDIFAVGAAAADIAAGKAVVR